MDVLLLATDFSAAARNAYHYALQLASDLGADLYLVHVNDPLKGETTLPASYQQQMRDRMNADGENRLRRWATPYPDQGRKVTWPKPKALLVRNGAVTATLASTAEAIGADAIILGAKERHNIREHLFGSVSTKLIGRAPCPMLIVPETTLYTPLRHIAFAIDLTLDEHRILSQLREVVAPTEAQINPFFVNMLPEEQDKIRVERLDSAGQRIDMVRNTRVSSGITYYLEHFPAEMLAMYIPKRAFHQQLLHGHLLRYMVWETPLPLLLIRQR